VPITNTMANAVGNPGVTSDCSFITGHHPLHYVSIDQLNAFCFIYPTDRKGYCRNKNQSG